MALILARKPSSAGSIRLLESARKIKVVYIINNNMATKPTRTCGDTLP